MDQPPVGILAESLTSAFDAGIDLYAQWKEKQDRQNHYRKHKRTGSTGATKCALSTSLDISSHRIKATYQVGFALIGPEFSAGDAPCRECLAENLSSLEGFIDVLRRAALPQHAGPLNLNEIFLASEAIRSRCVSALAEQYERLAAGRSVPRELPIARPRPTLSRSAATSPAATTSAAPWRLSTVGPVPRERVAFDQQTAVWSTSSGPPAFQSEPPSPPPTPKLSPAAADSVLEDDDARSTATFGDPAVLSRGAGPARRPKNGVFSIFCPEAMALQVDVARPVPAGRGAASCFACGYRWKQPAGGDEHVVKDGFRMTRRFLAKSHCDQRQAGSSEQGQGARQAPLFGCVLCASTGCAETYENAERLRAHINAVHTKWQMLHDRDLTRFGRE